VRVAWHLFPEVEVQFAAGFEVCVCVTLDEVNIKWFLVDIHDSRLPTPQIALLDWLQKTNCVKKVRRKFPFGSKHV